MRGATRRSVQRADRVTEFLLTRPMRGATTFIALPPFHRFISTHTPHAGRDMMKYSYLMVVLLFLLTRPMRGATRYSDLLLDVIGFLLTRPMRGATAAALTFKFRFADFYSHAPCGARPPLTADSRLLKLISTHTPHAGRDIVRVSRITMIYISTHTPHAGRDGKTPKKSTLGMNFYSHAPCGARLVLSFCFHSRCAISTHTPHAGRDAF